MSERAQAAVGSSVSPGRRFGRWIMQIAAAIVALIIVLIVWWVLHERADHAETAALKPTGPPPEVGVIELQARSVPFEPQHLGETQAAQTVEIRARVSGFLDAQQFEEGTMVEAGQELFQIDPEQLEAEVAVARAGVQNAEATREFARNQLERLETAVERGAATSLELDEQQLQTRIAEANVSLQEARLRQAELELSYTSIKSPIRGLIGQSLRDVGSYVTTTDGLLAVVEQVDPIDALFTISEQQWLRFRREFDSGVLVGPGEGEVETRIVLSDGRIYPHAGLIDFISTTIDTSTSTALIRARVPNPEGMLRPGQFVRVTPLGFTRTSAVVVPQEAVVQLPTGSSVYVVSEGNEARTRPVVLGDWTESGWIVQEGLEPGDRVIVDGLQKVREGAAVTPVEVRDAAERAGAETDEDARGAQDASSDVNAGADADENAEADANADADVSERGAE